jgi:hypothetical protein
MKQERKDAIGMMVFSLLWIIIAVILFLFQAHYRVDDFIEAVLGKGLLASLFKIPVSLIWILIYFGGFFGLFGGLKQLVMGKRSKAQEKKQQAHESNAQKSAPTDKPCR